MKKFYEEKVKIKTDKGEIKSFLELCQRTRVRIRFSLPFLIKQRKLKNK
ncbi:MAG: hypothetical protein IIU15_00960 [Treponema sp.]|nr:hypothetical protein [Treponema sp.]MBQ5399792.1 hypothetical protein [Treponema sp.]